MPVSVQCQNCGKSQQVIPARAETFKFCSVKCRSEWRSKHFRGEGNPRWQAGSRERVCQHCGVVVRWNGITPYSTFSKQKFCAKKCADLGGLRHQGAEHWNYKPDSRRKNRGQKHHAWANAVISRDKAICQHCGATGVELHAHHVESFSTSPALRYEVSNGITLCHSCHWAVHTAQNDNGVNSGNISAGHAGDNPEPSLSGNIREGVTTRGRAYRRWEGRCNWCDAFLSKRLSDATGKKFHFCSHSCSGKHRAKYGGAFGRPRQ